MGMRPSATICYSIEVPREKLEAFLAPHMYDNNEDGFNEMSEALQHAFKNEELNIAFEFTDWFSDIEDLVIYTKSCGSYGYGDVTEVDSDMFNENSTSALLNQIAFHDITSALKLPSQTPKWRIFAEFS